MNIYYNEKGDLLYIRLDENAESVTNRRITEDIVLDIDGQDKLVGIEILDASKNVNLERIFPISYGEKRKIAV